MYVMVARKASSVRYGTTPSQEKNAGLPVSKPVGGSCSGQRLLFEVHRHKDHQFRNRDAARSELLPLPLLRRWMIDLEDAQAGRSMRVAVSERVESGAQHDILPDSARDGPRQFVFSETAAGGNKCA